MTPLDYGELLRTFSTELVLLFLAGLVLFLDLRRGLGETVACRTRRATGLTAVGLVFAGITLFAFPPLGDAPGGTFVLRSLTLWLKAALLILSFTSLLLLADTEFTPHVGEFCALFLLATEGLLLMVGTENLLMLFIALELSSLSLYGLTALNQRLRTSTEAALKYFFVGSTAAAFTLFGISLLYGLTGTIQFSTLATRASALTGDPLLWLALALTIAGFGFKIAAVPFHAWAPDVYQAAPGPVAALVASGSKLAGFFVLLRLLQTGLGPLAGSAGWLQFTSGWLPVLAVLALTSMLVGNLAALAQTSLRRLVAWSAIAQAGYALIGLMGTPEAGEPALLYFAFTYGLAVIGVFGVLGVLETSGEPDRFESLTGLWRRSPALAICLTTFVLSLAGIPPLAGFFGKLFLFIAAARRGGSLELLWLVVVALGLSVVSLYYYLRILKPVLVADPATDSRPLNPPPVTLLTLITLAAALLILGCVPQLLFLGMAWLSKQ